MLHKQKILSANKVLAHENYRPPEMVHRMETASSADLTGSVMSMFGWVSRVSFV